MNIRSLYVSLMLLSLAVAGYFSSMAQAGNTRNGTFSLLLNGFETKTDLTRWWNRGCQFELRDVPVSQGHCSAVIQFKSALPKGERWPAIGSVDFPTRSWKGFSYIAFEIENPSDTIQILSIWIQGDGGDVFSQNFEVIPGKQTIRYKLPSVIYSNAEIKDFQFLGSDPLMEKTFYVDNLRLETENLYNRVADLKDRISYWAHKLDEAKYSSLDLQIKALDSENAELAKLDKKIENIVRNKDLKELDVWNNAFLQCENRVNLLLGKLSVDAFWCNWADNTWGYATTHSVVKIMRDRADWALDAQYGGKISVELARNEYEGAQLILRSRQALNNVHVSVSDLKNDDGAQIPSTQVSVLPVGYVKTKNVKMYACEYAGWWPDPLLNYLEKFNMEKDVWQPIWLDVHVDAQNKPGLYHGIITVEADGLAPLKIPLEIKVWNFKLPVAFSLPMAISLDDREFLYAYKPSPEAASEYRAYCSGKLALKDVKTEQGRELLRIRHDAQSMMLDHRMTPDFIYRTTVPLVDEVREWKRRGSRTFVLMSVERNWNNPQVGSLYPKEDKTKILNNLKEGVPQFKKAGLLDMALIYGFDETGLDQYSAITDMYGELKKLYPEIPLLTTSMEYTYGLESGLDNVVDGWVPLTPRFAKTPASIQAARNRGKKIWWYICCTPPDPYANFFIQFSSADPRLLTGFMAQKFKPDGFLYYSADLWRTPCTRKDENGKEITSWNPFELIAPSPFTTLSHCDGKTFGDYYGDGMFIYPGKDGPIPSIRLKNIRDGMEDYEYLCLLDKALKAAKDGKCKVSQEWIDAAEAALKVDDHLVKDEVNFTKNGSDILKARQNIANLLNNFNE